MADGYEAQQWIYPRRLNPVRRQPSISTLSCRVSPAVPGSIFLAGGMLYSCCFRRVRHQLSELRLPVLRRYIAADYGRCSSDTTAAGRVTQDAPLRRSDEGRHNQRSYHRPFTNQRISLFFIFVPNHRLPIGSSERLQRRRVLWTVRALVTVPFCKYFTSWFLLMKPALRSSSRPILVRF